MQVFALATEEPHELTLSEVVQYVLRVLNCWHLQGRLSELGLLVDRYGETLLEGLLEGRLPCEAAQLLVSLAQSNVAFVRADQSLIDLSNYVQAVEFSLEHFGIDAPDEVIDDYDEEIVDWCRKALPSRTAARRLAARELTFV